MAPVGADAGQSDPSPTPRPVAAATATPEPTREPTPEPTERRHLADAGTDADPAPTPVFGEEPTGPTEIGTVVKVVDGDTIDVIVNGVEMRVRYIGMDTPEVHNGVEWLGPESSAANSALVVGQEVVLEKDVPRPISSVAPFATSGCTRTRYGCLSTWSSFARASRP